MFRALDQKRILTSRIYDDAHMHEVEDSVIENPFYRIFPENPLQLGFFLESITPGELMTILSVEKALFTAIR